MLIRLLRRSGWCDNPSGSDSFHSADPRSLSTSRLSDCHTFSDDRIGRHSPTTRIMICCGVRTIYQNSLDQFLHKVWCPWDTRKRISSRILWLCECKIYHATMDIHSAVLFAILHMGSTEYCSICRFAYCYSWRGYSWPRRSLGGYSIYGNNYRRIYRRELWVATGVATAN